MNGVLVVDKPAGPTSHDVVARVRRATRISRIGHTGTLDPLATGVLPLVMGRATRLAQFLSASDKEYVADVRLGVVSETYDAEGPLVETGDDPAAAVPAPDALDAILGEFRGTYWQVPPPFSAKKVAGVPAYRLARRKQPAELKPVTVTVPELEVLGCEAGVLRLRLVVSSGFYVRTLAHEIGQRLGCGAYLAALRRTRAGGFPEAGAVPLQTIEAAGLDAAGYLVPIDALLTELPAVVLPEPAARRVSHGNAVSSGQPGTDAGSEESPARRVRLLDESGRLLAIAERRAGGLLHPAVVLV